MPDERAHPNVPEPITALPVPEFDVADVSKADRIGQGGDADVFSATVEADDGSYPVAIKEPRFQGTIQRSVVERFVQEAETWSKLDEHTNIVSVYQWGTEPLPWLALEYMDGGTLEQHLSDIELPEALWLGGRIADGVYHGHRRGVVHLDLKPSNILLRETPGDSWPYPKVSDWGLAKLLLEHSNSIDELTPTYAAPEQFDTEEYGQTDNVTDIYQLGAVLYAMLTGEPPHSGSSKAVLHGVLQKSPTPPSEVNPALPEAVDEVVLKALEKRKADRYDDIIILRNELDELFEQILSDGLADATTTTADAATSPSAAATDTSSSSVADTDSSIAATEDTATASSSARGGTESEREDEEPGPDGVTPDEGSAESEQNQEVDRGADSEPSGQTSTGESGQSAATAPEAGADLAAAIRAAREVDTASVPLAEALRREEEAGLATAVRDAHTTDTDSMALRAAVRRVSEYR